MLDEGVVYQPIRETVKIEAMVKGHERDLKARKHYGSVVIPGADNFKVNYSSLVEEKSRNNDESDIAPEEIKITEIASPIQISHKSSRIDNKSPDPRTRSRISDLGLHNKHYVKDKEFLRPKRKNTERFIPKKNSID